MNIRIPVLMITALLLVPPLGLSVGLSGCKNTATACETCGEIQFITPREVEGKVSPTGAIAGAIVGGVLGHQFGSGRGRDAATVVGAVGGAVAGREIEREHNTHTVYDVTIRMSSGELRTLTVGSREGLHEGAKVEIRDGRIVPVA